MVGKLKQIAKSLFDVEPHERLKVLFLSIAYFVSLLVTQLLRSLKIRYLPLLWEKNIFQWPVLLL